ncbi:DNA-binding transcriptional regulator, ArsR family [Gracilibacillus ureilyticus]|uniref:DNA-binding transcriptional regulator, ArsR family n=1 Tax=Gracilibacillus ureilyticus TaxID=531814 RepID=A0A1H9VTT8_9BACI|nr:DNA-binding transcriptional regulator, ArsR family [Gracilibacillus ureilyticus]
MNELTEGPKEHSTLQIFQQLSPYFQGLGDPVRQQIIVLLIENESLNVTMIAESIPMSRPNISHHLKILKQAGLVQVQKKGTEMFYRLEINDVVALMKQLIKLIEEEGCLK